MVDLKIKLPDSFFEEEERYGYVTSREMKQLWAVELDLLCEFDRVCRKLRLQYFLHGGTLIGAVRDGRFIPWDDDIDVIMLRAEYDRLLKLGPSEFQKPYFLQNAYTDIDYRRGISQLRRSDTTFILKRETEKRLPFNQGICIDIFVLDGLPPKDELPKFFEEKQRMRGKIGDLAKKPGHDPMEVRELFREYEAFCSRFRDTEYVENTMHRRSVRELYQWKRAWFSEAGTVGFEGLQFPIFAGYREFLSEIYGPDYMMPKREPTYHGDVIVDVDRPYGKVLQDLLQQQKYWKGC